MRRITIGDCKRICVSRNILDSATSNALYATSCGINATFNCSLFREIIVPGFACVEGIALPVCCVTCLGQWAVHLITRTSSGPMGRSPDPVTPLVHQRPSGSEVTPTYSYSYAGLAYWACLLQHEGGGHGCGEPPCPDVPQTKLGKTQPNLPTDRRDLNLEGSHVLSQHVGLSCPSIFEPRASLGAESPSGDYARRCGSGAWFGPGPTTLPLFIVGQDL